MSVEYRYNSLEDFLVSRRLTINDEADDGWGARFPVKGREVEATILFSDISGFSRRTREMSPAETLIFVNTFFAWISAEGLRGRPGIVDKYIGDEIMVVFSNKTGLTPLVIAEGHRPGLNFRPSPETVAVLHRVMRAAGVTPPRSCQDHPPRPQDHKH